MKTMIVILLAFVSLAIAQPQPYVYPIELLRVVDGDTIDVSIDLGFGLAFRKERVRLLGVDAYEMTGSERPMGVLAAAWVEDFLGGSALTLSMCVAKAPNCVPEWRDNFGRILGVITREDGLVLNNQIIDAGFAVVYGGYAMPSRTP